jgi:hypothetical protein
MGKKLEELLNTMKNNVKELFYEIKTLPQTYVSGYFNPKKAFTSTYLNLTLGSIPLILYEPPKPLPSIENFRNTLNILDPLLISFFVFTFSPYITSYASDFLKRKKKP